MAGITNQAFAAKLKKSLSDGFKVRGITAKVQTESVPTTKLYRVAVTSSQFKPMSHSERQSIAWRIVDEALSPDEQHLISMILTLTETEKKSR